MIVKKELTEEQVLNAVNSGEFSGEVTQSADIVFIVMTQNWCPQWIALKSWIYSMETAASVDVYELVYNTVDYGKEFRRFKETVFRNDQIPYLRFYKGGKLFKESNYVGRTGFSAILEDAQKQ